MVLTLLAEDAALPCSPPVRPCYYLLKAAGPALTGREVSEIIKFLQVLWKEAGGGEGCGEDEPAKGGCLVYGKH